MITHKPKAGSLLTGTEWEADDAHREPVVTVADAGPAETLNASAASVYNVTLTEACTFTLTGATDGDNAPLIVILRGAFATTWPAAVEWLNGAPQASSLVVVQLLSVDGGTEWIGTTSREPGPVYDIERYTAGDITVNSATAGADLANVADLSLAAVDGDLIEIGVSSLSGTSANSLRLDVATIVSAAVFRYISSQSRPVADGGDGPATNGVSAWFCHASTNQNIAGSLRYVLQSGDTSGGTVTLSLRAWVSGGSRVLGASTSNPLLFWAQNHGQ